MQRDHRVTHLYKKLKYPFFLSISTIIADQVTKYLIRIHVAPREQIEIVGGFFRIIHAKNTGIAFSLFSGINPALMNPILTIINVLIISAILYLMVRDDSNKLMKFAYGLVVGGAVGNLLDRFFLGYVIDFLDFYVGYFHWPAFNVADAAITSGLFLLIFDMLLPSFRQ
jgi:signal peptidase II